MLPTDPRDAQIAAGSFTITHCRVCGLPNESPYVISHEPTCKCGKPECCDPSAPMVKCVICKRDVYTCERKEAVDGNYACPVHPDGVELAKGGDWVCSEPCWDAAYQIAALEAKIDALQRELDSLKYEPDGQLRANLSNDAIQSLPHKPKDGWTYVPDQLAGMVRELREALELAYNCLDGMDNCSGVIEVIERALAAAPATDQRDADATARE